MKLSGGLIKSAEEMKEKLDEIMKEGQSVTTEPVKEVVKEVDKN